MTTVRVTLQRAEAHFSSPTDAAGFRISGSVVGQAIGPYDAHGQADVHPLLVVEVPVAAGHRVEMTITAGFAAPARFAFDVPTQPTPVQQDIPGARLTLLLEPVSDTEQVDAPRGAGGSHATIEPPHSGGGRVEFVLRDGNALNSCPTSGFVTDTLQMGLWQEAWSQDPPPTLPGYPSPTPRTMPIDRRSYVFRNGPTDPTGTAAEWDHFIACDPRSFFVRVTDHSATTPTVTVSLTTLGRGGPDDSVPPNTHTHDDAASAPEITCRRLARGVYGSPALMIVSSDGDLHVGAEMPTWHDETLPDTCNARSVTGVHTGLDGAGFARRGQPNFRLRLARMNGYVRAGYGAGDTATATTVEMFRGRRRALRLCIHDVDDVIANTGDDAGHTLLWRDLRVAREVYARIGVWLWTDWSHRVPAADRLTFDGHPTEKLARVTYRGVPTPPNDPEVEVVAPNGHRSRERSYGYLSDDQLEEIAGQNPCEGAQTGIRIFYTRLFASTANGVSWTDAEVNDPAKHRAVMINAYTRGPYTLAHEIFHVLCNSAGGEVLAHYPPDAPDRMHNLLRGAGLNKHEGWWAAHRIREEQIAQIQDMLDQIAGPTPRRGTSE